MADTNGSPRRNLSPRPLLLRFGTLFGLSVIALLIALPWPSDLLLLAAGSAIFALLIAAGLLAAAPFGRGAPIVDRVARGEPWLPTYGKALLVALIGGVVVGAILLALLFALAALEPAAGARLAARADQPGWMPWALAVEASILEEFIFRLFMMSGIVWLLTRLRRFRNEDPSPAVVWSAIAVSALGFGLAHLPSWFSITSPTPFLIAVVLALNGLGGVVSGSIYWRWGIEAAIVCHFAGDMVVQAIGPRLFGP